MARALSCTQGTTERSAKRVSVSTRSAPPTCANRSPSSKAVSSGFDRDRLLKQHGSRVHAFIHQHRGNPRFRIPVNERPLDRGSSPVGGQQGTMDVDAPHGREIQDRFGKDSAKRGYGNDVRFPIGELPQEIRAFHLFGLTHWATPLPTPVLSPGTAPRPAPGLWGDLAG